MKVEILFQDKSRLFVDNVRKVANSSTNTPNDWLGIYIFSDIDGHPSIGFPMSSIICVEVTQC